MPDGPPPLLPAAPAIAGRAVSGSHDFIIIGSGPAGPVPAKTLRETVLNLTGWRERGFYGRAYRVKKDIAAKDLMMRLHMTLDHQGDVLEHQFARNGVETFKGTARFLDPHRIEVTSSEGDVRTFQGERFL